MYPAYAFCPSSISHRSCCYILSLGLSPSHPYFLGIHMQIGESVDPLCRDETDAPIM